MCRDKYSHTSTRNLKNKRKTINIQKRGTRLIKNKRGNIQRHGTVHFSHMTLREKLQISTKSKELL